MNSSPLNVAKLVIQNASSESKRKLDSHPGFCFDDFIMRRRHFIKSTGLVVPGLAGISHSSLAAEQAAAPAPPGGQAVGRVPIGVSSYSFWRFTHEDWRPLPKCLEAAADMGFDGLEILQRQLTDTAPAALREIKRRAQALGMPLMGYSTHQGFVSPDAESRKKNVQTTIECLEQAYILGIPTMRVNTGTWGTRKDFDDLMAHRGEEDPKPGFTHEDGFKWAIECYQELAAEAEKRGVVMGLENHWGLGRTPEGVRRVVEAVASPWLKVTLDTGNFLEDPYEKLSVLASQCVLLQAKTYFGGGTWYTLDLDYGKIAQIMKNAGYRGWVSLEFEGKEEVVSGIKKSLELLQKAFR